MLIMKLKSSLLKTVKMSVVVCNNNDNLVYHKVAGHVRQSTMAGLMN